VLRAILEANAGLALWIQWLILLVLQTTRAATSAGPDLDSWMADFGLTRLPAVAAAGAVTFARFSPTTTSLVPAGTLIVTADGSRRFAVAPDPANTAWNQAQNGYLIAAGTASLTVPIVAMTAGSAGDVQAGTITLIQAAIPGVDTVNNAAPTAGGIDAESDPAFRTRFAAYINSRSRGTTAAVGYAISSVQQDLAYTIQENATQSGTFQPGCFVVTVDNGTGAPSAALVSAVANAIETVRPLGSIWTVVAPSVMVANVSMTITTAPSVNHSIVAATVEAGVASFIDGLALGTSLPWSQLTQVAYNASPLVTNVSSVLLNGGTADITAGPTVVVKSGSITVS
jgi:uncharacterized phage protein gp47/JayE